MNVLICEYERNSFPTQSVTIKLRQHKSTLAIEKCAGAGIEPTTFCVQGRRPNH